MMKGSKLTTNCNLAHFLIDFVDNCCYIEPLLTKPNWNCSMSDNNFTIRPIELFKVLSDPTRLKIFQILFNKESRCVGELVEILDQPQPTISRHLNHLKKNTKVLLHHLTTNIFRLNDLEMAKFKTARL